MQHIFSTAISAFIFSTAISDFISWGFATGFVIRNFIMRDAFKRDPTWIWIFIRIVTVAICICDPAWSTETTSNKNIFHNDTEKIIYDVLRYSVAFSFAFLCGKMPFPFPNIEMSKKERAENKAIREKTELPMLTIWKKNWKRNVVIGGGVIIISLLLPHLTGTLQYLCLLLEVVLGTIGGVFGGLMFLSPSDDDSEEHKRKIKKAIKSLL